MRFGCLLYGLGILGAASTAPAAFHCDPVNGADDNAGTAAAPFKSLVRAQLAVQGASKVAGVNVFLEPGLYKLDSPLALGPKDSGTANQYVHWQGTPMTGSPAPVTISGGEVLTGWKPVPNATFAAQQSPPVLQCAADHGTSTPCCGQKGNPVPLANQCPEGFPTCVDYIFESHYGHCTAPPPPPPQIVSRPPCDLR